MIKSLANALGLVALLGAGAASAGVPEVWQPPPEMSFSQPVEGELDAAPWWTRFDDPRLSALIDEGLSHAGDVRVTTERVRRAEMVAAQTRAALFPQLAATGSVSASPSETFLFQIGNTSEVPDDFPTAIWQGSATLSATWPIDLWGKTSLATRAAYRSADASAEDLANLRQALSAQIAEAYFDLLATGEQLAVQEEQLTISSELLELMELRYEGGQVTGVDVLQQRGSRATAAAQLPQTRAQLAALTNRLTTLVGRLPTEPLAPVEGALPALPPPPPTGEPADLMENRPDLRAASWRLKAASDSRRSATVGYLPSLSATASYGYQGRTDLSVYLTPDIPQGASGQIPSALYRADGDDDDEGSGPFEDWSTLDTWSVGLSLSVPLFTGGRTYAAHQAARADERGAAASYQQAILAAVGEVEAARAREIQQQAQLEAVEAQVEAARLAFEESRERYIAGLEPYLTTLSTQSAYRQAELARVLIRRSLLTTRLQLHLALGGAWTRSDTN